CLQDIQLPYTF
nr:immunoglobulin light chain junction region [Macaca mulatta]MOW56058.1 immunoglobulin light chain junction region [Macaca mulatta]MOW56105.1 immunoglobulin light chain junction region [Macaca mulatta]